LIPKPAFELTEKKLDPKTAAKKPAARPRPKRAVAKAGKSAPRKEAAKHSAPPKASATSTHSATPKTDGKKIDGKKTDRKRPAAFAANTTIPKPSPAVARPSPGSN
jgi:hypothetical protein